MLTVCCVHYVVEIVYCETAILTWFSCNAAESVFAFVAWLFSALSGEEVRWFMLVVGVDKMGYGFTFVEEQEEADRASAKKEVTGIEFKDIAM